jgi:hypothetical protein
VLLVWDLDDGAVHGFTLLYSIPMAVLSARSRWTIRSERTISDAIDDASLLKSLDDAIEEGGRLLAEAVCGLP